jgi:hypothetical protein
MEGLALNTIESCNQVLAKPTDYQARADLMWCATLALNGLTAAGLGLVGFPMHMIEHSLSALYDVPHGAGLSVIMPAWMAWRAEAEPVKFAQFARRVFNIAESDDSKAAGGGIKFLKSWFRDIKSPVSLAELDIPESAIPTITENALALAKIWRLKEYEADNIAVILRKCL